MAKNKKPTKRYTPKSVKVPVTAPAPVVDQGLIDSMTMDVHFALMAVDAAGMTVENWKRISKVLMTVSFATDGLQHIDKGHKIAIDSAVLTLKAVSDTEVRAGKWYINALNIKALKRGLSAAEAVMPGLSYHQLVAGYLAFSNLVRAVK